MSQKVRTRYAPSPTGFQHIGGIRTALYCYLFTRKMGGSFILRIEDTDQKRYVPGAEEYVVESLKWCGIECDEATHVGGDYGPYRQSERKEIYGKYAMQMLESGHAYYAFDTSEELDAKRNEYEAEKKVFKYGPATRMSMRNSISLGKEKTEELLAANTPWVIRLKIPAGEEVIVEDMVRGMVRVNSNEIDDKVLLKGDGMPTYHLANVVDDHLMEITHVIRGEEWLPSTPLHVLLYRALGWESTMPKFAHLPLILKPTGKGKLSKRDGDKMGFPVFPLAYEHPLKDESSTGYREIGFFPEAFVNLLAFLGWNPGTTQEIFSMEELIEAFSIERIGKSGARFDWDKAQWFNQQYIKEASGEVLAEAVLQFAPDAYKGVDKGFLAAACDLMKERMTFLTDIWETGYFFFESPREYDSKVVRTKWKPERVPLFHQLKDQFATLDEFSAANIEATVKIFMSEHGLGFGDVLQVFRVMLAGTKSGPSIFDMAALLGKEEVLKRMEESAKVFDEMKAG